MRLRTEDRVAIVCAAALTAAVAIGWTAKSPPKKCQPAYQRPATSQPAPTATTAVERIALPDLAARVDAVTATVACPAFEHATGWAAVAADGTIEGVHATCTGG